MKPESFSRRVALLLAMAGLTWCFPAPVSALSMVLNSPQIHFPPNYDEKRAAQLEEVLRSPKLKYLGGLTSHWEPEWSTTLVYDGDAKILNGFLAELNRIEGFQIRITVSPDLSKETGSALQAGSWWVKYSHTAPDTVTVRINLAAEKLRGDLLEIILPKGKIKDDGGK